MSLISILILHAGHKFVYLRIFKEFCSNKNDQISDLHNYEFPLSRGRYEFLKVYFKF